MGHPIEDLVTSAINNLKDVADANTVVGTPLNLPDGTTIVPISKVSIGVALGGSDFGAKTRKELFGAGTGAGVSVVPVAFLAIKDGNIKIVQFSSSDSATNKVIDLVPEMFDKVTSLVKEKKKKKED